MIHWQENDPLPPWGQVGRHEGITVEEWIAFAVAVLALGVLVGVSVVRLL